MQEGNIYLPPILHLSTPDLSYALAEYTGNPKLASFLNKWLSQKVTL